MLDLSLHCNCEVVQAFAPRHCCPIFLHYRVWTWVISETFDHPLKAKLILKYTSGRKLSKPFVMILRVVHVLCEISCTTHLDLLPGLDLLSMISFPIWYRNDIFKCSYNCFSDLSPELNEPQWGLDDVPSPPLQSIPCCGQFILTEFPE